MGIYDQFKAYVQANTPRSTRSSVKPSQVIYDGLLRQPVENIKANAAGLLAEVRQAPEDMRLLGGSEMSAKVRKVMQNPQPMPNSMPQQWMDAGMELSGMAPVGGLVAQTVYHGSPHKFNKFDMSKIGTGEGAQAYGHGLYFAESPGVAKSYQDELSKTIRGHELDEYIKKTIPTLKEVTKAADELSWLDDVVPSSGGDYDLHNALEYLAIKDKASALPYIKSVESKYGIPVDDFEKKFNKGIELARLPKGAFYKVDIPDEIIPRMLDWDKPLSEQTPEIQDILRKNTPLGQASKPWGMTGEQFYRNANNAGIGTATEASKAHEYFKNMGIPGIRYLDGNSRGTGGTSNYVLFDDQLPRILEVNGQPTGLLSYADEAAKKAKK